MTATSLRQHERKVFSQNGEDGVLERLFADLGPGERFFVEIGTGDGSECNTRLLRERHGWRGVMLDAEHDDAAIGLHRVAVTAENIDQWLRAHGVQSIDLLSIDVDGIDFYLWHALRHAPRVLVIEYNAKWPPPDARVVRYDPQLRWNGSDYFGASFSALVMLGRHKGYVPVHAESAGVNLFFVRADLVHALQLGDPIGSDALYRAPGYGLHGRGHPADPLGRPWLTFEQALAVHAPPSR